MGTNHDKERKACTPRALTFCQAETEDHVRIDRERESRRDSQTTEQRGGDINQDSERKPVMEGHSRPVEYRGDKNSGHQRKASEPEALTNCRAWRGGNNSGQ